MSSEQKKTWTFEKSAGLESSPVMQQSNSQPNLNILNYGLEEHT